MLAWNFPWDYRFINFSTVNTLNCRVITSRLHEKEGAPLVIWVITLNFFNPTWGVIIIRHLKSTTFSSCLTNRLVYLCVLLTCCQSQYLCATRWLLGLSSTSAGSRVDSNIICKTAIPPGVMDNCEERFQGSSTSPHKSLQAFVVCFVLTHMPSEKFLWRLPIHEFLYKKNA